jgi:histone-lysine N-methyltransferase SETMAR
MLSWGIVMLHDNAHPYTAAATQDLIATFRWEQFNHPLYSPYLAPRDFHVFLHPKTFLGGRRFHDDNEVKEAVNTWFAMQAASFYGSGIQKLVPHYDKCLNNGENYVEK